jgi:hypothetical protein
MHKFVKKWHGRCIEDLGCIMSDEAKQFYKEFKAYIKSCVPAGTTLVDFKPNHYDFSGFICYNDDTYIYVSHSLDRFNNEVRCDACDAMYGVLIRSAEGVKDYHGGPNHFTSIYELEEDLERLHQFILRKKVA